ncbi:biotin--acetyl-CoA-carboxylase ligase [Flammeovirgaceae bacterium 311]|nr:biotin--acetyl-CoA-carboxylase ligase [Flammeovirgaceae bacterium 311]
MQQENLPEGTVIITNRQIMGRGQRGNSWEADSGQNLTFSIILRPRFLPIQDQFLLNISISLAISDFLTHLQLSGAAIKWPNDLYAGSKKLGGILIESSLKNAQLEWSVVGIGINVNQKDFMVPTATSLALELGQEQSLQQLLDLLLKALEVRYLQLRQQGGVQGLRREYLDRMYWLGEWHEFESAGTCFTGKIVGIDAQGKLAVLHQQDEQLLYYSIQQIRYLS